MGLPSCTPVLSCAVLPSPEQPGLDLHHLRGRPERVPGERHREPADVHHPHHRGSAGGCPALPRPPLLLTPSGVFAGLYLVLLRGGSWAGRFGRGQSPAHRGAAEEPPQGTAAWLCGQRLPKRLRVETTDLCCASEPLSSRSAEVLLLRFAAACRDRAAWSGPRPLQEGARGGLTSSCFT